MADEIAGWPSRETGIDPIIGKPGSHQRLPQGTHAFVPLSAEGNKIPRRSLPVDKAPPVGPPCAVNPLGRYAGESQGGGDASE